MVVHNPVDAFLVVHNLVDAFLVVLITLPVPIFISTYYIPPKRGST
jgi:hypothetical protein